MKKLALLFSLSFFMIHGHAQAQEGRQTAYERVTESGVLRCAYIVYPPETIKDPVSGELSGTVVDIVEEAARQLEWDVEWVAEVGFADMFDGLRSGKYDALCSGLWKNPARAKNGLFTIPLNYGIYYPYVRAHDDRFDDGLDRVNQPDVKIAVIDGEYADFVARESFPQADTLRLPQLSDISQIPLSVATGKADIAFLQKGPARRYIEVNPGKLRALENQPVRVMPAPAVVVPMGEHDFKYVLDSAFEFLLNNGFVEKTLRKYDPELESYHLIAKPYAQPEQ